MGEKIKRGLGVILILVGLSVIVSIAYKKIDTANKQKELQRILEQVISEEPNESGEAVNTNSELQLINGQKPIALIEIPSIKLSQGIVEGMDDEVLKYYLGHFEDSAKPGEKGNFSVAGHRVSDYSDVLVNLYKTEVGDEIIVKADKKKYIYKITDNFIVNPDRVDVLDNTDEATITLITCTVGAKERVVVKGNLVEITDL